METDTFDSIHSSFDFRTSKRFHELYLLSPNMMNNRFSAPTQLYCNRSDDLPASPPYSKNQVADNTTAKHSATLAEALCIPEFCSLLMKG